MRLLPGGVLILYLSLVSLPLSAQQEIASAEASFKYIASTLQTFRGSGRLVNNPGIDGADLEAYIDLLDDYYQRFSTEFNRDSAMCRFYLDPENARMTIEDRAEVSFSFLRNLNERIALYQRIDQEFQESLAGEFGTLLLDNVNRIKRGSASSQQLPSRSFDQAAIIAFLDSACI